MRGRKMESNQDMLNKMLSQITDDNKHPAVNWGEPVGNERFWLDSYYVRYDYPDGESCINEIKAENEDEFNEIVKQECDESGAIATTVSEQGYVNYFNSKLKVLKG